MRIIPFVVFYIATYVARIAIAGDIAKTMPGSGVKYIFKQKNEATRNRIPELPIDGIIRTISKRNRRPLLGNRIDGFPRSGTILNNNLKEIERSLGKRERYAKSSDSGIANRRDNYPNDDNTNEERFPIWRVPKSTVDVIHLDSTSPSIVETGMIDRLSLESERPPSQSESLGDDRSANEAVAGRYQNSRELFQLNASNRNLILPKLASPKSRIKARRPDKKMSSPAYRPGILAGTNLPGFSGRLQGFQRRHSQRDSSKELFNNRPTDSNERFLLVPVSKGLYVLKNVRESPRLAGIIVPKRYKPSDEGNATSAILSFKAHMHHDVKDVGRAYLQRGDHRLFDHNANYLYPNFESTRFSEEGANPTENPVPPYCPDFLYLDTAFQTGPNSVDDTLKNSEEQAVSPVPGYDSLGGINSYDSSSSFLDISDYNVSSKKDANDGQSSVLSTTKLDDEVNLFQQGNCVNYSLGYSEFGVELTTVDFQNTFGNVYTPATLENVEMYLTNDDKEVFDVSREVEFQFSTGSDEDKPTTGFANDISTQHRAFDASANEDNTFLPNIIRTFVDNVISNTGDVDEDNQAYEISIPDEYNYKKSTPSNDFDYDNRFIDRVLLNNCTTVMDSLLNVNDYVTPAPLNTDGWPSKTAQSNVENSHDLLMAIKPLFSELGKLLNTVQLVNRSISDVQSKLCDKKNVVRSARTGQEGRDRKATDISRPADEVDYYNSDLSAKSFDCQSSNRRRDKTEGRSTAEHDVKIRRETNGLFLNKLTTPFRKRGSSIGDSEIRSGRENAFEKRKLSKGDVVERRLPHSRFNRNLKSLTKSYGTRANPIRQLIESGLKRTQRTTMPIIRTSRLTKSNVSSENNFAGGHARDHRGNEQKGRSIISSNKTPFWNISTKKENLVEFLSDDKRDLTQRNVKKAMSSKISTSGEEKTISPVDQHFFKEATSYLDVLRLLDKMETPHVKYPTDIVWTTQTPTESPLISTTTEFSVSTSTFSPYFTEASTIATSRTTVQKKKVFKTTKSFLHEYITVTDFRYGKDYDERNLTQSPVTLSVFTITMPTILPLYTTELTSLSLDKAAILTSEKITTTSGVAIIAEVTESTKIAIPTIENFTIESTMLLTPFLEGMTDITLKITIPAATKILIEEITPALIAGTAITEEETEEGTSTTLTMEITQSSLVEINISSYTFSTVLLFGSTETEWTIKTATSTVPISITLAVTKYPQTVTSESTLGENLTLYEVESTVSVASSPSIFERTEATISTLTEVATTTLTPEENESPVSQIEKTITAEETATEIPTIESPTSTETTITAVETSTTAIKVPTTETLIPTKIVTHTTFRTPITKETTSAKTLIPTETNNKTTWTSIETSETTTITEITETVTATGTSVFTETPAISKIPTTSTIPTIIETTTIAEILTSTKITATTKIPMTKKTTSTKVLTPTAMGTPSSSETQIITEISTTSESSGTTEIPVISTTYITTKFYTSSESTISSVATMPPKKFFPTSTPTPFTVVFTTETAESTLTSSITPVTTSSVKTTVPTMKLTTSSQTLLTTPSKTPYIIISSMLTTTKGLVTTTSFKTTSLKVTTTTLVTSTMPSETASTTLSTEETTASSILTTTSESSLETFQTTSTLPILTTVSTTETFLTTSSVTAANATVSSTTSTITAEILESTISSLIYFTVTTPFVTKIQITTPIAMDTGTTAYKTTSTLVTSSFLTEIIKSTTPIECKGTTEYYYESTKEEMTTVTSAAELTKEFTTIWITAKEITAIEETTPMTSFATSYFIETTTETTSLIIETITSPTITEEISLSEKIVTVTPRIVIKGLSTFTEVTLISTEISTMSAIETSTASISLVSTTATTTASLLEETAMEVTAASLITTTAVMLPTTKRPEYTTILEAAITVTLASFSESILSIIITTETPATTPEVVSTLPKTVSEELAMSTTEGLATTYGTKSSTTLFIETATIAEKALEAETEYYVAKEPFYEEEYEEYEGFDTEIPTDKWYYYDEYETTTTMTRKYTKLPKEKATSASITIENVTTPETEFTASIVSEEVKSTTTRLTFGSTEEYTLPSSTIFTILTEPLEHLSIPPRYTDIERFTQIRHVTSPKFITKLKEIPEIVLKKTTTSERVSTEVEVETLTSFFVSSVLTTLSEKEAFEVHVTTMSTATPEKEDIIETGYEVTTSVITEEETVPRVTPFITSEAEIELALTTTSKTTVEREEEKGQILQRLYDIKQHEKEMAEREERLKEREKQWSLEKEKRRKMQREKEKNITIVTGTTKSNVTTTVLTVSTTESEVTSFGLDTSIITLSLVEITTIPTATTPFSITEESTYTSEGAIIEGSTSTAYTAEETEQAIVSYTTEKSTSITYITKEMEVQITDNVTLAPYITTSVMVLCTISLASIETTTPYAVEEMYTSYVTLYNEPSLTSPTITSPLTLITDKYVTLPIATFSETFEETSVTSITTPTWYATEERFTSSELQFTTTTILSTLAIRTTAELKYEEEIEKLKEKLRKKERELKEREKILLEREEKLKKSIIEFEKYIEEYEKKSSPSEKSTVLTSLSTPMPPTEKTTLKPQLTTQIKKVTEKKENRTTTRIVTSRHTDVNGIEEKNWIQCTSEKIVTPEKEEEEEEEIVTKRICLNVLENTTIPLDKKRRGIVIKKVCLPYFPEKNQEKSGGRISRRLLALENTREIRGPRWDVPLDFRYRRKMKETTRKIDNLQLLHHEWLSNETTKPLQHFKGFTRIYKKMRKFPKRVATNIDAPRNTTGEFQGRTPLYEQRVLNHESVFRPITTPMLDSKKDGEKNAFFRYDLISTRKSDFPTDDKSSVQKRDVPIENSARFSSKKSTSNVSSQKATTVITDEDGTYTVNVLHLSYNKDKQTHEVISAKPDEDELTGILSEPNDDVYVTQIGEDEKITTPHCNIEEKDDLTEEYDDMSDGMMKKTEEDEDYVEDQMEEYMNYEEHETSTRAHDGRFSDKESKNKKMTENDRELLDREWPTEKSTTYHLGGTRFWELEYVTEPPAVLRTPTDKNKTIDVSIARTTCLAVVLKNERDGEIKTNVSGRKRNVYNTGPGERVSIEKRNASLKNVTRTNALRYKLGTKRPGAVAKKLKRDSQRLHRSNYNYYKRGFVEKGTVRLNGFRRASNEDSITAKSRKLCAVNANKLKCQTVKRDDAAGKQKKKRPAKSRASQSINLHSPHNTDNCTVNKKSKYHKTTNANRYSAVKYTGEKNKKVTHSDIIGRKSKSTSASDERKIHSCFNCICDIASVVRKLRSLLDGTSFPLDEIKALNCSEYKEIQDEIVISTDSSMEEAREFPQPHYNTESLKGQKYIRLEELDNFEGDLELDSDHDVISLPGLNLNLPCNQDGDGITWLSSVSRPSYTWKRTDGITLFGFMAENGDLELRNVNAKDTGNYTCVMTYLSPDNEEPVETTHEIHLQVVTLPRYIVHSESRYHVRTCDEGDLDMLVTYLPLKLNSIICEADMCNAYVLTPSCSRSQITVNILLVPSHVVKLMVDSKRCNVFCLKAIQDKLSLILSRNLQIFLGRTIIFRLSHYEQRLVPIIEKSSFTRRKRGKTYAYASASAGRSGNVGLFSSCPAGYGLRDTRCVPCNVGTYSEDGVSHCKKCPPGTFQPNHGARICRTCTNPMMKGCYNMLWNSFSAVMVTLASVGAMLSICLLLLWIICCAKKKFCVKQIVGLAAEHDTFEREKHVEEQPLIKDASENDDQQWDSEYRVKRGKFYVNKKRRKQNERRKYKTHLREDELGSHRIKNTPIIGPDSYRSHEDYNNHYPKRSHRKGPRLPECDFDT